MFDQKLALAAIVALNLMSFGMVLPAAAQLDVPTKQVEIESRFVNVTKELFTSIGVQWNRISGSYSSTGGQAPADSSSSGAFGTAGLGANVYLNTGVGQMLLGGSLATGPLAVGVGMGANGYFGGDSQRDILRIIRHHLLSNKIDVVGSRGQDWSTDFTARLRVPILNDLIAATPDGKRAEPLLNIDLAVGPSLVGSNIVLRIDQTDFGGSAGKAEKHIVNVVPFLGAGISKEITKVKVPLLGDIPVLGRIFYGARRMPGAEVSKRSTFGFTETFQTEPYWSHEAKVELVILITPTIIKGE